MNAIVAMCANMGIGLDNQLPWKCRNDMLRFKKLTIGKENNIVVMGKNTWESVGILPKRHNFIISTTLHFNYEKNHYLIRTFKSIQEFLQFTQMGFSFDEIWVIGGSTLYKSFLDQQLIHHFYVTYIDKDIQCDTFMCTIPNYFLKQKVTICDDLFESNYNIYYIIYKKIIKDMKCSYKKTYPCIIKDIHFDTYPDVYCTIDYNDKECQTSVSNLSLN